MNDTRPWIGVDFDGTLAQYHTWKGLCNLGDPVPSMLLRVRAWIQMGHDVRIVTARGTGVSRAERDLVIQAIHAWCEKHVGVALPVVHGKDFDMIALWDDAAVSVETNTGERLDGHPSALDPEPAGRAKLDRTDGKLAPFLFKLLIAFAEAERDLYENDVDPLDWDIALTRVEQRANILLNPLQRRVLLDALQQKAVA